MVTVCAAKAAYRKSPGLLELTDSFLQWTPDAAKAPSLRIPRSQATSLFCSKEGAAQVRLKLGLFNDEAGHNFTFLSAQPASLTEREKFKKELTAIISVNRSGSGPDTVTKPPVAANNASTPVHSQTATPKPSPHISQHVSRAASISSDQRASTPVLAGHDAATDFRLRRVVLMANPELLTLHRDLVMTGQISEAEFWDGREHLLLAQASMEAQKKGKPGQIVDPRPETVEGGEIKIRITPQLVHDIFDEYPVVAKAYNDNVPQKLTEEEFWKRYFQSKLFNAHRASIRSSATQHVVKDDPIFDKYLQKVDDELEPRRQRNDNIDLFVNLGATEEDHGETGNQKDVTMQAGRQRGALPLMRKFNEHSERLLNAAMGDGPPAKRRKTTQNSDYTQIELDDLYDSEKAAGILLDMKDSQRYFESRSKKVDQDDGQHQQDTLSFTHDARMHLGDWASNLAKLNIERERGNAALAAMTQNVAPRLDIKSRRSDIPEPLLRQMTTCQTAANEFLRQFWAAMYPPRSDASTAGASTATSAQRAGKAAKMAAYLAKTSEKVEALVQRARMDGVDHERVRTALKPVLNAAERAVVFHQTKKFR